MKVRLQILISLIMFLNIACNKGNRNNDVEGDVDIFLLSDYKINNETDRDIIFDSAVLAETPFLTYANLLSYNSSDFEFIISDAAKDAIQNLEHSVRGVAFGVTANNKLVYTGYFWPSYSSALCRWLVIDPVSPNFQNDNKLVLRLGYPSDPGNLEDNRNHPTIINIFSRDKKLID